MQKIIIPTHCPVCAYKLELVTDQLFCRNIACEAQVGKKIEHFCKTLKIKGMGPATIAKLQLEDITQVFFMDKYELASVVGEKVAEKLLAEIEFAKSADFPTVLSAMSIPLVGNVVSNKLAAIINNFDDITFESCKEAGLGDKATENLLNWVSTDYKEIKEFLPFKFEVKEKAVQLTGKIVCITGKLVEFTGTKKDAAIALNAKGYQVVDSVTKTVNFLIDEENKQSTKRKQADKYGIPVFTSLQEFLLQLN